MNYYDRRQRHVDFEGVVLTVRFGASIDRFCRKQTFAVADLNDWLWSATDAA